MAKKRSAGKDDAKGNDNGANLPASLPSGGQMLIYRDGSLNLQVRLEGQTVWLTQAGMAELFQTSVPNINIHIRNILEEKELEQEATIKDYLIVQVEEERSVKRFVAHYNLDMILAVGYRVRSPRGTQFRQWATVRLRELLVKGFVLDDERIKAGRTIGQDYFHELLARIRAVSLLMPRKDNRISGLVAISWRSIWSSKPRSGRLAPSPLFLLLERTTFWRGRL